MSFIARKWPIASLSPQLNYYLFKHYWKSEWQVDFSVNFSEWNVKMEEIRIMIFENCLWKTSTINERLQKCRNVHGFRHVKAKLKFSCPNRLKFHYRLKSNKRFLWHEKAEILKWLWLSDNHHFVRKLKFWQTFWSKKTRKVW